MQHDHDDLTERLTTAMQAGVQQARVTHKALGLPIVIWRDGRPVWVDAETLAEVPPPPATPPRAMPRR